MASSPPVQDGPEGIHGQDKISTDREFDRKPKTRFHVFSVAPSTGNYSTNCIKAERAIATAIEAVDKELFSQITADVHGSELKSCTYFNKAKDDRAARFCTKFELYSVRALELFRKTFPLNHRASNPHAGYTYSWPDQKRYPKNAARARQPMEIYMALAIRGGQKIPKDTLTTSLSSAGATLCSTLPMRGHGFNTVSMKDSMAIIKCVRPPKNITIGDKRVPLFVITPVDPVSASATPPTGSYAAAAARATPAAAYQIQAWHAIKEARSQKRDGVLNTGTPATTAAAATANTAAPIDATTLNESGGVTADGQADSLLNHPGNEQADDSAEDQIMEENVSLRKKYGQNDDAARDTAEGGDDGAPETSTGGAATAATVEEGELVNNENHGQRNNSDSDEAGGVMEMEDKTTGGSVTTGNEETDVDDEAQNKMEKHTVATMVGHRVTRSTTTPRTNVSPTKRKTMASTTSPSSAEPQRKSPRKTPRKTPKLVALRLDTKWNLALPAPEGADDRNETQQE